MMKWTEKQRETIESRDRNILVSAAAGSGKTAVLVERIKQLILGDKVDVDRFLITTFTKAAAAEMKERLEEAIRKSMEEEGADRPFLARQLRLMPRANISTFHSFTIEVMRRYFYLTDLEPGVKIGDDTRVEILSRESIEEVFDRRFAEDGERFRAFLTKYSGDRNENRIKEGMLRLYKEMRSLPHYMEWAKERTALMGTESPVAAYGLDRFLEEESERAFEEAWALYGKGTEMLLEAGLEKLGNKATENLKLMMSIPRRIRDEGRFPELKYESMRASKEEKEEYDLIKNTVKKYMDAGKQKLKDLAEAYYVFSLAQCDEELKGQADDAAYLVELLEDYERVFRGRKAELGIVDFDDVMHYAIDILDDETACAEYREKFRYIFVDEYQDCNQLQETIVEKIARENNLFMVGDIKQSIYRFRLAEPDLFRNRYERYKNGDQSVSRKIDLSSNFRSKRSVTDTVNAVFGEIMEGYDEDARLICTAPAEHPGMATELHIVPKDTFTGEDDQLDEAEAALVARLIRENLGAEVYDTKNSCTHLLDYGDIVVLTRNNATIADLERYLNNTGIPAYGSAGAGYFETVELQVFINLLRVIDNTSRDVPLLSVMRSVAFGFTLLELASIRSAFRDGSYHSAVRRYAEGGPEQALRDKIRGMLETIDSWKQLRRAVSLEELVKRVLDDTGYLEYCSGLPVGRQRIANLRLLISKAADFELTNYTGLHGFLEYVEAMKRSGIRQEEANTVGDGENVVRITSIHRSKGLEFPVVILAGTGKRLKGGSAGTIPMHKDFSIGLTHVDREGGWHRKTLLQKAIAARKNREAVEEEIRILYVALTRAKDKLIITGTVDKEESLDENFVGTASFLQMLYAPLHKTGAKIFIETDPEAPAVSASAGSVGKLLAESASHRDEKLLQAVGERLSWTYPHARAEVRSKYSVSQLSRHGDGRPQILPERKIFSEGTGPLTPAAVGTAMHSVMERLDFTRAAEEGEGYIASVADGMLERGLLSGSERDAVSTSDIMGFFRTPVGQRAAKAAELFREREFIMRTEVEGEETIVQGIIDCYFEEEDGFVLIDYKNSYIGSEQTEEVIRDRYRGQLELYREALTAAWGKRVKETYLYLFHLRKFIKID